MRHVPHCYIEPPWDHHSLTLTAATSHHLTDVLRLADGATATYPDGQGRMGTGTLAGETLQRGTERSVARPEPAITIAVAPPRSNDRARFLGSSASIASSGSAHDTGTYDHREWSRLDLGPFLRSSRAVVRG